MLTLLCFPDEDVCTAAWTGGQRSNPDSASAPFVWKRDMSVWKLPSSQLSGMPQTSKEGCLLFELRYGVPAWRMEDCAAEACVICQRHLRTELQTKVHWTKTWHADVSQIHTALKYSYKSTCLQTYATLVLLMWFYHVFTYSSSHTIRSWISPVIEFRRERGIAGPPQGSDLHRLPTSDRRPSLDISKTVQDRPI